MSKNKNIIEGRILSFDESPFNKDFDVSSFKVDKKRIFIIDGIIDSIGPANINRHDFRDVEVVDYGDHLISAGFVDAHVHYPQTAIIASWGKRLIDWLNVYTFPEEMRFQDLNYASEIAANYINFSLSNGTTTMASYCTIHPESVDAFFEAAAIRNMCVVAGKTCMDHNAPDDLCDTAQTAYDDSKALLERWHQKGRAHYAITPRFSPTSTPDQLSALGLLWSEFPECLMQTHLSEQVDEIDWVRKLFPKARDYLDTYETFGLLGERGVYGHAIHLETREIDRLSEVGASLIHCPTSNTFIGSGLFDMENLALRSVRLGLASDIGGGSSFSMLRTMASAYEVAQLRGFALHPAQLMWLATQGSAKALHLDDQIGNIAPGIAADLTVLNLSSTPVISQRSERANNVWEELFPTIMMGDDRAIAATYIAGKKI
jgi:guanine deaminase